MFMRTKSVFTEKQPPIVKAHWAANCAMQWFNILPYNYFFFRIECIATPNRGKE